MLGFGVCSTRSYLDLLVSKGAFFFSFLLENLKEFGGGWKNNNVIKRWRGWTFIDKGEIKRWYPCWSNMVATKDKEKKKKTKKERGEKIKVKKEW